MRIRNSEKVLRFTADYRAPPPPPIPSDSRQPSQPQRRSSLIDNSINLCLFNHRREAKMEAVNEDRMIVLEKGFEAREEATEEKVEEKRDHGRKRREIETEASNSISMIKCKKTDGKGWHCKRQAQTPHSLCTYHLTQLRSYRARFEDQISGDRRKKSASSADYNGGASNYYYYYSILGPWWGKRRGPANESSQDCNGNSNDNEAAIDGDDGDDNEEEDDDDDDGGESCCDAAYKKKKKNMMIKKRGRKPVKARSLKSLL